MKRAAGFTLTEMMVVMAIVAILLSVGVPSYRYITNSYRMSSEVNGLLGDLMYARAEAIKEGNGVTVCASANSTSCLSAKYLKNVDRPTSARAAISVTVTASNPCSSNKVSAASTIAW